MITTVLRNNQIESNAARERPAVLTAWVVDHATHFGLATLVEVKLGRMSGVEETVTQALTQVSIEAVICLFGKLFLAGIWVLSPCCQVWKIFQTGRFEVVEQRGAKNGDSRPVFGLGLLILPNRFSLRVRKGLQLG
jgi:hypothetical protein